MLVTNISYLHGNVGQVHISGVKKLRII